LSEALSLTTFAGRTAALAGLCFVCGMSKIICTNCGETSGHGRRKLCQPDTTSQAVQTKVTCQQEICEQLTEVISTRGLYRSKGSWS
jgi:hypothetical protein